MATTNFDAEKIWDLTPIGAADQAGGGPMALVCQKCSLHLVTTDKDAILTCFDDMMHKTCLTLYLSGTNCDVSRMSSQNAIVSTSQSDGSSFSSYMVRFSSLHVRDGFCQALWGLNKTGLVVSPSSTKSLFNSRTDDASASQYFQFYGYLSQQQNMMQDYIRTATYQRAILENYEHIMNKVVLDVGAGSGILSFFAVQAGAKTVYAVEASSVAIQAEQLVKTNGLSDKIKVLCGKIEEIELPEMVDVIISEPMGYMLFNERMLETFLHAKKWLKPGGAMLPNSANLYIAPFSDESLFLEQVSKSNFWLQTSFYGIDLSALKDDAISEYFRQPIVDTFDPRVCLTKPFMHKVDFVKAAESDLYQIAIDADFGKMNYGAIVHGCAFWFDVSFPSPKGEPIWLSTSPSEPLTHWYQVRCLLQKPIMVTPNQQLIGSFVLKSNSRQSYDINMRIAIKDTDVFSESTLDLKNPYFRYTGQAPPPPPPGQATMESPTDHYYGAYGNTNNQQYYGGQPAPVPGSTPLTAAALNQMVGGGAAPAYQVAGTSDSSSSNCNINNSVDALTLAAAVDNHEVHMTDPDELEDIYSTANHIARGQ